VQFRDKVELAVEPLVKELRGRLAAFSTLDVLNYYQFRLHLSQLSKEELPDGFWAKSRYIWALLLSQRFSETNTGTPQDFSQVDELVEKIFELYSFGAVYESGPSEPEYLSRLGLALGVREVDMLGFPEQFKLWSLARLTPFNEAYFLPVFGSRVEDIFDWLDGLISTLEARINRCINDMATISRDIVGIENDLAVGAINIEEAHARGSRLRIGERIESNGRDGDSLNIFSTAEISQSATADLNGLVRLLLFMPEAQGSQFTFPHDTSPINEKLFVDLPGARVFCLDPACAYRIAARSFEKLILSDDKLRDRYLRNRDRATESLVAGSVRKVFPNAEIYPNYYLEKGRHEKDLLVRDGQTLVLIECKNSRVRAFRGATDDLLKFERDFANSVQFGYDQAHEAKTRILGSDETTFLDEKGRTYFSIKRGDIREIYIVCVAATPRGLFGTDVSYQLKKEVGEPFPLALGLFDFQTICDHFDGTQFLQYLKSRESLHGRIRTGDELNYAGYFLKFGHLNFPDHMLLTDEFSGIFDRKWYRGKGIDVEEPKGDPVITSMNRKGNRVMVERSTGRRETIRLPPWVIAKTPGKSPIRMTGAQRNMRCPCGSGLKLKHCCGID
jgi:SEC-C motif